MKWELLRLTDIFEIARGGSPRPIQKFLTDSPDGLNWIMIGDAKPGSKYITSTKKKIKPEGLRKTRMVQEGDFLLTNSMSFGRPFILGTSGCIHDGWLVLSPKTDKVFPDFFYYLLGSNVLYREFTKRAAGAVVKNLNTSLVKQVQVPLPPLTEQKRIAAILDTADALRAKRRETLAQLDTLLQSTFLEMFGDPVTNPKGWDKSTLGELAASKPNNGIFKKNPEYSKHPETGFPVVWVEELFRGSSINVTGSRRLNASDTEIEKYGLKFGDILFCRSSLKLDGIGYNNVYLGEADTALFECHLIRISPKLNKVAPLFLNLQLRSAPMRAVVKSKSKTATMTTIDQKALASVEVVVPPFRMQQEFSTIAQSIEQQKSLLRTHLSKLDTLFASLQARAFAGEL